jgi:hypothetical protein
MLAAIQSRHVSSTGLEAATQVCPGERVVAHHFLDLDVGHGLGPRHRRQRRPRRGVDLLPLRDQGLPSHVHRVLQQASPPTAPTCLSWTFSVVFLHLFVVAFVVWYIRQGLSESRLWQEERDADFSSGTSPTPLRLIGPNNHMGRTPDLHVLGGRLRFAAAPRWSPGPPERNH